VSTSLRAFAAVLVASAASALGACEEPMGPVGLPETLDVAPDSVSLTPGQVAQLSATVRDSAGNALPRVQVTWYSGDTTRVRVSATGRVTAVRTARVMVFARVIIDSGGVLLDGARIKVLGPFAFLGVGAPAFQALPGDTLRAFPVFFDSAGNQLAPLPVTWSTSNSGQATVAPDGLVTIRGPGDVVISAHSQGITGNLFLHILVPVSSVTVTPQILELVPTGVIQIDAALRDSVGGLLLDRSPLWSSSDTTVVRIDPDGMLTAVAPGSAVIVARREAHADTTAVTVARVTLADVSVGSEFTCGLSPAGRAWCWGFASSGQLGLGTIRRTQTPAAVVGGLTFDVMSAGAAHACGVTPGGAAYCWGYGIDGALGDGGDTSSAVPVAVAGGLTFRAVSAGGSFTCGLTVDGVAYCWGYNRRGQLGTGDSVSSSTPLAVGGGLKFTTISAGRGGDFFAELHTCGVALDSLAYCWGYNGYGELGDSASVSRALPAPVYGSSRFIAVSAGGDFTCGLTVAGAALCWGAGANLGNGSIDGSPTPVVVLDGHTFTRLTSGRHHTCALRTVGDAYCWGSNARGQLGANTGTSVWALTPVPVLGGRTWTTVAAGEIHTCGVTTNTVAYCWLGVPTPVVGQP